MSDGVFLVVVVAALALVVWLDSIRTRPRRVRSVPWWRRPPS
jgi:hypothetical protein